MIQGDSTGLDGRAGELRLPENAGQPASVREFRFSLLGKFEASVDGGAVPGLEARRVQELICFLLLARRRPHHREVLADALWGDAQPLHARKHLRNAIWQLRGLRQDRGSSTPLIQAKGEWVRLHEDARLWLDVAEIEQVHVCTKGVPPDQLDGSAVEAMRRTIGLYSGELLEGWYQDWCVRERERVRTLYLGLLEKLLAACEVRGLADEALVYGSRILREEPAHEETHRCLMRLWWFKGDRTSALRQFGACRVALQDELGVEPEDATIRLYRSILAGETARDAARPLGGASSQIAARVPVDQLRAALHRLDAAERLVQESLATLHVLI